MMKLVFALKKTSCGNYLFNRLLENDESNIRGPIRGSIQPIKQREKRVALQLLKSKAD